MKQDAMYVWLFPFPGVLYNQSCTSIAMFFGGFSSSFLLALAFTVKIFFRILLLITLTYPLFKTSPLRHPNYQQN